MDGTIVGDLDGAVVGDLDGTKVGRGFLLGAGVGITEALIVGIGEPAILGAKVCVRTSLIEQHTSTSSSAVTRIFPTVEELSFLLLDDSR